VAVGSALAGATIVVIDANGNEVTGTSGADGSYSISIAGLTPPFLIIATDPSGNNAPLYSVTASITTTNGAPVVANVTPLTSAVVAQLTNDGNPLDLTTSGALTSTVTPGAVDASVAKLNTSLDNILTANGLNGSTFNPITGSFTPNQTGADAVIDAVIVTPTSTGGLQLASVESPGTTLTLDLNTSNTTQLAVPSVQADYLATLLTQLGQCLGGTSSACSSAIDANYLENGYASFQSFHSDLAAAGSTITGSKTLAMYPAGQFPNSSVTLPSALVQIFYTDGAGQANYALTVVQQLASGSWDIIGNQQQYDINIASFLDRNQYEDPTDAPYSRYEAGLNISIPTAASGAPNPVTLASASVTGPGLTNTVWLEPRNAVGNDTLSLTSHVLTSAPTGGTTTNANTTLYRWSWQALSSSGTTFTPSASNLGHYASAPIDVTTVAPFAVYTVRFYDIHGTQIGQPVSVINPTPPLAAQAGTTVPWQTLGSDVISNFLSPSGSLAAQQASVNVDWSNLVSNQNIAPLVDKVEIQSVPGTGVTPSSEIDGWWIGPTTFATSGQYAETVTAGIGQNGVQQCTSACQFSALVTGASRNVELYWNYGGSLYYNLWHYDD